MLTFDTNRLQVYAIPLASQHQCFCDQHVNEYLLCAEESWLSMFQTTLVCFGTFLLVDEDNVLTVQNTFVSLAYLNATSIPLNIISMLIVQCAQVRTVSPKTKCCRHVVDDFGFYRFVKEKQASQSTFVHNELRF